MVVIYPHLVCRQDGLQQLGMHGYLNRRSQGQQKEGQKKSLDLLNSIQRSVERVKAGMNPNSCY